MSLASLSSLLPAGLLLACLLVFGCSESGTSEPSAETPAVTAVPQVEIDAFGNEVPRRAVPQLFEADLKTRSVAPGRNAARKALFGDLHIHTRYSFDAFAFGTIATPSDAYRYAKGEAIKHPAGFDMKLPAPLDFLGVTDHAMFLGAVPAAADTTTEFSKLDMAQPFHDLNRPDNLIVASNTDRSQRFSTFIPNAMQGIQDGTISRETFNDIARSAWQDIIDSAEAHNDPGSFTTFVAYEYTSSTDERGNLHRNVIFRSGDRLPEIPFSRFHSQNPEGLWHWMDELRGQGIDSLAIPHNSNGSNGAMFALTDWAGNPIDSNYAGLRMRNEPLVEVTQVKGTSDTHPLLSPNDEWADFEIMPYRIATTLHSEENGSYVHPHRRRLFRGGQLLRQDRHSRFHPPVAGFGTLCRCGRGPGQRDYPGPEGIGDRRFSGRRTEILERFRTGWRMGRGEQPGIDIRCIPTKGDLRDQRAATSGASVCRLRLPG
jgi:hypothetical protein